MEQDLQRSVIMDHVREVVVAPKNSCLDDQNRGKGDDLRVLYFQVRQLAELRQAMYSLLIIKMTLYCSAQLILTQRDLHCLEGAGTAWKGAAQVPRGTWLELSNTTGNQHKIMYCWR